MNNVMKRLVLCLLPVILVGCMSHGTRNTLNRTDPDKIEHIEAKDVQNEKMVMDEWQTLVEQGSNRQQLIDFIDRHIANVRPGNATQMLIVLEQEQRAHIDYDFYKRYRNYVTRDMSHYIDLMALESNDPPASQNGLLIRWQDMIHRALNQEKFIADFPHSTLINRLNSVHDRYIYYTLYGYKGTPLFNERDGTIDPEAREAYNEAIHSDKRSPYLFLLKRFVMLIERNDGKLSEEIEQFRQSIINKMA